MMAYYVVIWVLGKVSRKKLLFFWILWKLPPTPLPPIWTTCTTFFFERQKRWFKWHSKWPIIQNSSWIKAKYLPCESWIKPKKQFKVQIIGILEEIDSLSWTKSKRWATFFSWNLPFSPWWGRSYFPISDWLPKKRLLSTFILVFVNTIAHDVFVLDLVCFVCVCICCPITNTTRPLATKIHIDKITSKTENKFGNPRTIG